VGKRKKAVTAQNAKVLSDCVKASKERPVVAKKIKPPTFEEFFNKYYPYTPEPEQYEMREVFLRWMVEKKIALVLAMRNIGKTDIITIASVAYHLLYVDRLATFMIVGKNHPTLKDIASKVGDILLSEVGMGLFNTFSTHSIDFKENKKKQPSVRFQLLRSGGRGAKCDYLIIDDGVSDEDKDKAERRQTQANFSKIFNVQPSMFVIGQYAHEDDMHSTLEKNEHVKVSRFWWYDVSDRLRQIVGRGDLEYLYAMNTKRQVGHNYLGVHINDSDELYFKDIAVGAFEMNNKAIACIDPAFSDNATSDYTGLAIACKEGNEYYAHVSQIKASIMDSWEGILIDLHSLGVREVYIETNNGGMVILGLMKTFARQNGIHFRRIEGIHSSTNKQSRILNAINPIKYNLTLDGDGDYECVLDWYADTSEHDDGVDALAMAINELVGRRR